MNVRHAIASHLAPRWGEGWGDDSLRFNFELGEPEPVKAEPDSRPPEPDSRPEPDPPDPPNPPDPPVPAVKADLEKPGCEKPKTISTSVTHRQNQDVQPAC